MTISIDNKGVLILGQVVVHVVGTTRPVAKLACGGSWSEVLAAIVLLTSSAAAFAFAAAVTASGGTGADLDGADCSLTVGVVIVKPGGGGFKEWLHEMMWGKALNTFVKRAIELAEEAQQRYPEVHLNVHVCWFGNELVGELGIAQNPNWPFDGPNGHWPDLQADCLRHLRWFRQKCKQLGMQSAGLMRGYPAAGWQA